MSRQITVTITETIVYTKTYPEAELLRVLEEDYAPGEVSDEDLKVWTEQSDEVEEDMQDEGDVVSHSTRVQVEDVP